jgi:hypothetical protein
MSQEWVQFFEGLLARHFDAALAPECAPLRTTAASGFDYAHDYLRDVRSPGLVDSLSAEFLQRYRPRQAAHPGGA